MSFGQKKFSLNSRLLLLIALVGTLAATIISFSLIVLGRGGPSLAAYGIGSMSLFAFLLTIQVLHGKSESKDDFVKKGAVRTAVATSFTVAYLMLLALSLDPGLGLNLNNGIPANFHLVYIFTIGTYFVTASLEKDSRHSKGKIFTIRLTVPHFFISFLLFHPSQNRVQEVTSTYDCIPVKKA